MGKFKKALPVIAAVCLIAAIASVKLIFDAKQQEIREELVAETLYDGQGISIQDLADEYIESFNQIADSAPSATVITESTYIVGTDIPAGTYKLTCTDEFEAYWERCSDASGELDSIIANEVFNATAYVTVNNGEYLTISGCTGVLQ